MDQLRLHPIAVAAVSAVVLVGIGALIASRSFAVHPSSDIDSWGKVDGGTLVNNALLNAGNTQAPSGSHITPDDIYTPLVGLKQTDSGIVALPQPKTFASGTLPVSDPTKPMLFDDAALAELFSSVRSSASIPQSLSKNDDISLEFEDIYSYLPFSLKPWKSEENRTSSQTALFEYANTAGSIIEAYEDRHRDQAEVLKRFTNDMTDSLKADDVLLIAEDLQSVGDELSRMDTTPQAVRAAHTRMAAGYIEMGKRMEVVAAARTPEALFDAMVSYNQAADAFAQHFISISTTLQVSEVTFGPNDPGKMFVFTPA